MSLSSTLEYKEPAYLDEHGSSHRPSTFGKVAHQEPSFAAIHFVTRGFDEHIPFVPSIDELTKDPVLHPEI